MGRSQTVGSYPALVSTALAVRLTALRDQRRRRRLQTWGLRLLAATGGIWLLLVMIGSLAQSR